MKGQPQVREDLSAHDEHELEQIPDLLPSDQSETNHGLQNEDNLGATI